MEVITANDYNWEVINNEQKENALIILLLLIVYIINYLLISLIIINFKLRLPISSDCHNY